MTTVEDVPLQGLSLQSNAMYVEFWALVAFALPALAHLHFCYEYFYNYHLDCWKLDYNRRWPTWVLPMLNIRGLQTCELELRETPQYVWSRRVSRAISPTRLGRKDKLLEDIRRVLCEPAANGVPRLDISSALLSRSASQDSKDRLRDWLERHCASIAPDLGEPSEPSDISMGILVTEPYQPQAIEAHKEVEQPWRDPVDGRLYVEDTILWIVQKVSMTNLVPFSRPLT
jgi:hypothetical protein